MLDNILDLIKNTVSGEISQNNMVPEDKKEETIKTTAQALGEGLQQNFNLGNMSSLMGMFTNGNTNNNPIVNNISNTVSNALVQKVGLNQGVAATVATAVVPMVMNMFSQKVNDPNDKGFNLDSLVQTFTNSNSNGGLMSSLGKLFG